MSHNLFDLTGKKALVTGGNAGLGLGFSRGIARQGGDVILWARDEARNRAAEQDLRRYGGQAISRAVDVRSEEAVVQGMLEAVAIFGRLDCVVANAGIATMVDSVVDLTSEIYHDLLDVNLHGAFYTLREGARHMVERAKKGDPGGSLIVCGSLAAMTGVPGMAHYGAAKGALASIMKSMAVDLGKYGIRVNMIAPGAIKTDLGHKRDHEGRLNINEELSAELERALVERTPLGRVGHPEDLEAITAYLACDASAYHTGDIIVIDGGRLANSA